MKKDSSKKKTLKKQIQHSGHIKKTVLGKSRGIKTNYVKKQFDNFQEQQNQLKHQISQSRRTQTELESAQHKYYDLFDLAPVGYLNITGNYKILEANYTASDLLNIEKKNLIKQTFTRFIDKNYIRIFQFYTERVIASGGKEQFEIKLKRYYNNSFWALIECAFNIGEEKSIPIKLTITDITERKQAQIELEKRERELSTILDNSHDLIFRVDKDYRFLVFSSIAEKMTGVKSEIAIGKTNEELGMPEENIKLWQSHFQKVFETGKEDNLEYNFAGPNGIAHFNATLVPEYGGDGKVKTVLGIVRDITVRKQMEEALKENERKYHSLFDSIHEMVAVYEVVKDEKEMIVECILREGNPALAREANVKSIDEIRGKTGGQIFGQDYADKILSMIRKVISSGKTEYMETNRSDLGLSYITTITQLEKNFYLTVGRDISELKKAENLLSENERRLKKSQEIAHLGSWELDIIKNTLTWSDEVYRIFGLQPQEFKATYEGFLDAVHPEDRDAVDEAYTGSLRDGKDSYEIEHRIIRKTTGEIRYVHEKCGHERDESGRVIRSVGMVHDITERKRTEEQVEHLASFPRLNPNPVIETNLTGKIIYYNEAALNTLKILNAGEDLCLFLPYDIHEIINSLKETDIGQSIIREVKIKNRTYNEYILLLKKMNSIRIYTMDITERKKAEDILRETEENISAVLNAATESIFMIDKKGIIITANNTGAHRLNYSVKNMIGHHIFEFLSPEIAAARWIQISNVFESGEPVQFEDDRNGIIFSHNIFPIIKDGQVIRVVSYSQDITETKKATEDLIIAYRNLKDEIEKEKLIEMMLHQSLEKEKELSDLKSRFISTTSHEFRTPLTSVLSSIQLIQRYRKKWNDEKIEELFENINISIFNLTSLLDDILTISHADSGSIIFNPQMIDLHYFCLEIFEEVKHKANKNHKFIFNYTAGEKEYTVDPKLIHFILINLLSNAFKYSPAGGKVKLDISTVENDLRILVRDNGIGIPPEDKKNLFKPFFRAANTGEIEGTGLGLSIIMRAVELHKGSTRVYSKLGKGTIFIVKIPQVQK